MDARTQEEPGLGRMVLLSVVLHVVLFGSIAALTGGSGPVMMPDGVVSVLLVAGPPGPAGEPAGPPGGIPAREPEPTPEEESAPPLPEPEPEVAEPEPPAPPEEEPAVEPPAPEEPPAPAETELPPSVAARPEPPPESAKPVEKPAPARASKPKPSASEKPAPPPATKPKPKPAPREASPGGGAPGSGGGGGGGGGVGSVRLDSAFPYPWYLELIQRRVSDGWLKPGQARPARGTVIYFQIRSDGRVEQVRIERSSGSPLFDRAALRAVRAMNRLAPLPAGFREPHLGIHFEFLP